MFRRLLLAAALMFPSTAALAGPNTVAILYFDNQGNDDLEPLKVGLAQMLITDLKPTEGLTVVERAQIQAILDELELGHSGKVSPDTAAKVGRLLGAEYMVMGSYFELMGTLRIDARLVKVETSEILGADGVNGGVTDFMQMEKDLAGKLQGHLAKASGGATTVPAATKPKKSERTRGNDGGADAGSTTPANTETARAGSAEPAVIAPDPEALDAAVAFSEGLIALDKKDVGTAREAFEKAVQANPNMDVAKAELAALDL